MIKKYDQACKAARSKKKGFFFSNQRKK